MSYLEDSFALWLKTEGIKFEREYRFHPKRRWRFDFAWPDKKVAVEIEGISYEGGRHQRVGGFLEDCLKYEAALMLGWKVYRIPGPWIATQKRNVWRPEVIENLRKLLLDFLPKKRNMEVFREWV